MKKLLCALLIFTFIFTMLTSCDKPLKDQFFSDELLAQYRLSDMPVPIGAESSRLKYGTTLYFSMNTTEYGQYVGDLISYLRSKDDIYYLGYSVGSHLLAEMLQYDTVVPIKADYNTKSDTHELFFSLDNALTGQSGKNLKTPIEIRIDRGAGKLSDGFEYNVTLSLYNGALARAEWDPCAAEHAYIETGITYPIPGSADLVTEYACDFCGHTRLSDTGGDSQYHRITIEDTNCDHLLRNPPERGYSGILIQIYATRLADAELILTANGTVIPGRDAEGNTRCYAFIMPTSDVMITTETIYRNENKGET